ncbi:MAG: hypothetical protein MUO70_00425 [Euryarchaeota archaeon]|nr:hypothetical protein [Euryarchaeota archaeon]
MNDEKTRERKPKELSFVTGQEALIYEVERACGQLNKLKELQLNDPLLRAVAAEIRAHMDHLGLSLIELTEPCG